MKIIFITFFLHFAPLTSIASDSLIVKLINSIYLTQVDSSFSYYNLHYKGQRLQLHLDELNEIRSKLKGDSFSLFFEYAVIESVADSVDLDWRSYHLVKAKQFSHGYEIFAPPELIVINTKLTKAKQRREFQRQDSIINNWPKENYSYFCFSKPLFSKDKKLAIIRLSNHKGYTFPMGKSCLYLFKLVNDEWVKIDEWSCIEFTSYR